MTYVSQSESWASVLPEVLCGELEVSNYDVLLT